MTKHIKKVVVFCGASDGKDPKALSRANKLGKLLAKNGYDVIYGGGNKGLMGAVARSALKAGGKVRGIIPEVFSIAAGQGGAPAGTSEEIVEDMLIRKDKMITEADAAIAIDGGFGTLDEIFELVVANEISIYKTPDAPIKPMLVVNENGLFDSLKDLVNAMAKGGFIRPGRDELIEYVDSVESVVKKLNDLNADKPRSGKSFIPSGMA